MKKKILLAMIEAGGGHKSPALAVQESLENLYGDLYETCVTDFAFDVGAKKMDKNHKESWKKMLQRPVLTTMGYYFEDTLGPITREALKIWMKEFMEKGGIYLRDHPPDIFVSFHFMNTAVAIEAREKNNLKFPVVTYLTEPMDAHSMWVWKKSDLMIVSSKKAKRKLKRRFFPKNQIRIAPYPVRPSFFEIEKSDDEIRSEYGIDRSKPTVVMSSGAEGRGKIENYSKILIKRDLPINLIAVCGRNEELKKELDEKVKSCKNLNLIPLSYTTKMNELLKISDLAAIKASPGSTFEALLMGVPVIHMQFVTPSEEKNTEFILKHRLGSYAPTAQTFLIFLKRILNQEEKLSDYRKRIEKRLFVNGANLIAKIIDEESVYRENYKRISKDKFKKLHDRILAKITALLKIEESRKKRIKHYLEMTRKAFSEK